MIMIAGDNKNTAEMIVAYDNFTSNVYANMKQFNLYLNGPNFRGVVCISPATPAEVKVPAATPAEVVVPAAAEDEIPAATPAELKVPAVPAKVPPAATCYLLVFYLLHLPPAALPATVLPALPYCR